MNTITGLIRGPHTPEETATLERAADSFQDHVIDKIQNDGTVIRFVNGDALPKEWPLGASAINSLENGTGKNTVYFLRDRFNKGRAIHELFHAYDWKKKIVNGSVVWVSTSEQDLHVRQMHAQYRINFEHDFMKNVMEVLKAQQVAPGAWYPVALKTMEAMHYPFLAGEARDLFSRSESSRESPLVYYLARYQGNRIEVRGIEPEEGSRLQRMYRDYGSRTFEIPEWRKVAVACTRQAHTYTVDPSKPDRRFSEYAYLNEVREYTAEGAKFLMDTPETRRTLVDSDPDLADYLQNLHVAKN